MIHRRILRLTFIVLAFTEIVQASATAEDQNAPAPSSQGIDFDRLVKPLLEQKCAACHTGDTPQGEFSLATRDALLAGGASGPAVVVGQSGKSPLIALVAGADPDRVMPAKGNRLTQSEVIILRKWIDQGLSWPRTIRVAALVKADLTLRRPPIPSTTARPETANPVDRFLHGYLDRHNVNRPLLIDDATFARRVHLDLIGLLPEIGRLEAFDRDADPDKRDRLVRRLLDDRRMYADHWLTFWNDLLRNAYRGTGFIDGGRRQITRWIYRSLYDNKPYDQLVRELIDPVPGSDGFLHGIQWRGTVNASQRREMQAAQTIAQVFMGTTLKCASCHDSFVNHWRLTDSYALASVFADRPLEIHRCDKPIGQTAMPQFIYPQLGTISPEANLAERRKQLAVILTSPKNGRLARTMVNRLWARLFGRGLVEPLDDMDQPAWHPELLDWLAADFVEHHYDLKHTLARICTSRAYQFPSVPRESANEESFVFRGPVTKRMSAEQFVDALGMIAGSWQQRSPAMLKVDGRGQGGQFAAVERVVGKSIKNDAVPARWIWNRSKPGGAPPGKVYFRKVFALDTKPLRAHAVIACDNEFVLYCNGKRIAAGTDWSVPVTADVTESLRQGPNVLAVLGTNHPPKGKRKAAKNSSSQPDVSAAGLYFLLSNSNAQNMADALEPAEDDSNWLVGSDASWLCTDEERESWTSLELDTAGWRHAAELGGPDARPWEIGDLIVGTILLAGQPIRAALADADPLMWALGRPNREQLVTRRDSVATTLQAMELTNGGTLAEMLKHGAQYWADRSSAGTDRLVRQVYAVSLGREPAQEELATARELIGDQVNRKGIEDFLWVLVMLPEFQLY